MFGYTVPLYSRLSPSDLSAYRRYYCETCHQLRSGYGIASTTAVNYDMTFNTIVLNSVLGGGAPPKGAGNPLLCVLEKPAADSDLFRKMAAYTILLTKWELADDECDGPSVKSRGASLLLGRAISRAEREYPDYDGAVGKGFEELRGMEMAGCPDAMRMGEAFGRSLSRPLMDIAGEEAGEDLEGLFTGLCAAVYLMDAIDDLDEDFVNGTYNPLLAGGGAFRNKARFIEDNLYRLSDSLNGAIGGLQSSYSAVRGRMASGTGVADNIVYHGIPDSARRVMSGTSEARATLKNAFGRRRTRNASY
ncbi:MAG: DUF5685 family protein [Methanomassiliicoccaceae archaeon]|nr:DUF5685 family protein [Methanomassiliicoccaceae archaeon]